jgi:hypothetical protein
MMHDQDGSRKLVALLTVIDELSRSEDDQRAMPTPGQLVLDGLGDYRSDEPTTLRSA